MSWKLIWKAIKTRDMQKRMLMVALILVIFRFLSHVPVPIADAPQLRETLQEVFANQQLLGFVNLLSGGALAHFSIVLMGMGPYINASIITQLLTKIVPSLEKLQKEGEQGRTKINQYTRLLSLPLAIGQAVAMIFLLRPSIQQYGGFDIIAGAGPWEWVLMLSALVTGSVLLMWLGELISEQGIGNGISILIFAGIVTKLPGVVSKAWLVITAGNTSIDVFGWFKIPVDGKYLLFVSIAAIAVLIITNLVVKLNEAQRVVTVNYAKRVKGNRQYGGVETVLPIKIIIAGVIPIIFAVAFLSVPSFAGGIMQNRGPEWVQTTGKKLIEWFNVNGQASVTGGAQAGLQQSNKAQIIYPVSYFFLVLIFTFFYTSVVFNAKEIAENLQKQGGFLSGIRPGAQTEQFLRKIVNRLTLFGAISLGLIAVLPFVSQALIGLFVDLGQFASAFTVGGTGTLIVVSVAIETLRQIESRALMVTYDG